MPWAHQSAVAKGQVGKGKERKGLTLVLKQILNAQMNYEDYVKNETNSTGSVEN